MKEKEKLKCITKRKERNTKKLIETRIEIKQN